MNLRAVAVSGGVRQYGGALGKARFPSFSWEIKMTSRFRRRVLSVAVSERDKLLIAVYR